MELPGVESESQVVPARAQPKRAPSIPVPKGLVENQQEVLPGQPIELRDTKEERLGSREAMRKAVSFSPLPKNDLGRTTTEIYTEFFPLWEDFHNSSSMWDCARRPPNHVLASKNHCKQDFALRSLDLSIALQEEWGV